MKKLLALFVFNILLIATVNAQSKEEKLLKAVELLKDALLSGNESDLNKITSEKLTYGHSGGKLEDRKAFVDALASKKSDFVAIETKEQTTIINGKTAVVRHKLYANTIDNGKVGDAKLGVMLVFVFEKGDWKLLARQAFKL